MRRMLLGAVLALTACGSAAAHDETRLPVGDGKVTTDGPKRGHVYRCSVRPGGGAPGASRQGPWFNGDGTWDLTRKIAVDGDVEWAEAVFDVRVSGATRILTGNGLPTHKVTGAFPVAQTDEAYQYDRNPNAIRAQSVRVSMPRTPRRVSSPGCLSEGPIGYANNGVAIYDALDAGNRDALAWEVQDVCDGHPQRSGEYHYHAISRCLTAYVAARPHSARVGWALDGFGILGPRGRGGILLL